MNLPHIAVLRSEVTSLFMPIRGGVIIDCTVGFGSHSKAILETNPHIRLVCNDQDSQALEFSKNRLAKFSNRVSFVKGNFKDVLSKVEPKEVRGVLADLGVSSFQIDSDCRGFGFYSTRLDMRMDRDRELSAKEVVNLYDKELLIRIFKEYGEIRNAKELASLIVKQRAFKSISSAKELSELVKKSFKWCDNKYLAKLFQAIRIEVNDELNAINRLLDSLAPLQECIVALISFHSLEDREIKNRFKEWSKDCICPPNATKCMCGGGHKRGEIITKKPITPSQEEIKSNPRSRSAKLRAFYIKRPEVKR